MIRNIFLLCFIPILSWAQRPIFSTAKVDAVTVYYNSAEITQSANVTLPSGTSEVVIKNVSNFVFEETVLVGAPSNVTVLSVQYTKDYISEYDRDENSPALKSVRDSIKIVSTELAKIRNEKNSIDKTISMLDKNQQISGNDSGLSFIELSKIIEYYKSKRTELSNSLLAITEKETKYNDLLLKLNSKLTINESKEEKISKGKLILQLASNTGGKIPLQITYLSGQATWSPSYDLRVDNISSPVNMLYKAQISQNTGVDWKKVKLTLSSSTPNQNNNSPNLNPWFLTYYIEQPQQLYGMASGMVVSKEEASMKSMDIAESSNIEYRKKAVAKQAAPKNAREVQTLGSTINENQMSVSFDIEMPYDVASNAKAHSALLNEIKIPAKYKYLAIPKLDLESYLIAEVEDYSKYNILKGPANIVFEGMYVGKTFIDPNQATETLNLNLGKDKRVSIKREKVVEKSGTKFMSSFKEQTYTFDIIVKNNKKEKIELNLKDQYPLSSDESIKIELLESGNTKVDKEKGELSWDIKLAPNELKTIRISYKVRYPKDRDIPNL